MVTHRLPRRGQSLRAYIRACLRGLRRCRGPLGLLCRICSPPALDRRQALGGRRSARAPSPTCREGARAQRGPGRHTRGDRRRCLTSRTPSPTTPTCHSPADARGGRPPDAAAPGGARADPARAPGGDQCYGFVGTFAMKNADTSVAMGSDRAPATCGDRRQEVLVTGDGSRLIHVGGLLPDGERRPADATSPKVLSRHRALQTVPAQPPQEPGSQSTADLRRDATVPRGGLRRARGTQLRHDLAHAPRRSTTNVPGSSPRWRTGKSCEITGAAIRTSRSPTSRRHLLRLEES